MTPMFTHCVARAFAFLPAGLEGTFAKTDPNLLMEDPPARSGAGRENELSTRFRGFCESQAGQTVGTGLSFLVLTTDSAPSRMSSTIDRHSPPINRCQTTRQ